MAKGELIRELEIRALPTKFTLSVAERAQDEGGWVNALMSRWVSEASIFVAGYWQITRYRYRAVVMIAMCPRAS